MSHIEHMFYFFVTNYVDQTYWLILWYLKTHRLLKSSLKMWPNKTCKSSSINTIIINKLKKISGLKGASSSPCVLTLWQCLIKTTLRRFNKRQKNNQRYLFNTCNVKRKGCLQCLSHINPEGPFLYTFFLYSLCSQIKGFICSYVWALWGVRRGGLMWRTAKHHIGLKASL